MLQLFKNRYKRKQFEKDCCNHSPKSTDAVRNVGIIVTDSALNKDKWNDLKNRFKLGKAEVTLIGFGEERIGNDFYQFHKNQIDWKGRFKENSDAAKFSQNQFDVLINYYHEPMADLLLLSAATKAPLKIGFYHEQNPVNDLNIMLNPIEIDRFVEEVKKYLALINH